MRFSRKSNSGSKLKKNKGGNWLHGGAGFLRPMDESVIEGNHYFFLRVVSDLNEDYDVKPVNRWEVVKHKIGIRKILRDAQ